MTHDPTAGHQPFVILVTGARPESIAAHLQRANLAGAAVHAVLVEPGHSLIPEAEIALTTVSTMMEGLAIADLLLPEGPVAPRQVNEMPRKQAARPASRSYLDHNQPPRSYQKRRR